MDQKYKLFHYNKCVCVFYFILFFFQWDILSQGHSIKELARISTGEDPGNHLSLIQVNVSLHTPNSFLNNSMSIKQLLDFVWIKF